MIKLLKIILILKERESTFSGASCDCSSGRCVYARLVRIFVDFLTKLQQLIQTSVVLNNLEKLNK